MIGETDGVCDNEGNVVTHVNKRVWADLVIDSGTFRVSREAASVRSRAGLMSWFVQRSEAQMRRNDR